MLSLIFSSVPQKIFDIFQSKNERVSSQVRNLQHITLSALRLADIEDFVKNQMGKSTGESSNWRAIGEDILNHLDQLRVKAREFIPNGNPIDQLQLRLYLARGWVRAIVGAYLFQKAIAEMKNKK